MAQYKKKKKSALACKNIALSQAQRRLNKVLKMGEVHEKCFKISTLF